MHAQINAITKQRVAVAFFNLVLLAALGTLIRYHFYRPIHSVTLTYLHHAHSHVAFLGWVFMALFTLITYQFLDKNEFTSKHYNYLFWTLQATNIGMLFTFPFMGYAPLSIAFSTIHTVCSVIFTIKLIRYLKRKNINTFPSSVRFIIWAFVFMLIANLAPFALALVSANYGKSDLYYFLVSYYLHFQYDGWFTFALLGLFMKYLENQGINSNHRLIKWGLLLKLIAIFPVLSIAILSPETNIFWFLITIISAIIQLVGLLCLLSFFWKYKTSWNTSNSKWSTALVLIAFCSVLIEHILQIIGGLTVSVELLINRQVVVAYLHLVFVGFVTVFLLHQFIVLGFLKIASLLLAWLAIFIVAFIITEVVLLVRNEVPESNFLLFVLAILQLTGAIIFLLSVSSSKVGSQINSAHFIGK